MVPRNYTRLLLLTHLKRIPRCFSARRPTSVQVSSHRNTRARRRRPGLHISLRIFIPFVFYRLPIYTSCSTLFCNVVYCYGFLVNFTEYTVVKLNVLYISIYTPRLTRELLRVQICSATDAAQNGLQCILLSLYCTRHL